MPVLSNLKVVITIQADSQEPVSYEIPIRQSSMESYQDFAERVRQNVIEIVERECG